MDSDPGQSTDSETLPDDVLRNDTMTLSKPSMANPNDPVPENHEARLKRVRAYEKYSIARQDSLSSCLGIINAGLMDLAFRYQDSIGKPLTNGTATLADLRQLSSAMDCYLRIVRQTDRFSQMDIRLRETNKGKEESRLELQMAALKGLARDATRRNDNLIPQRFSKGGHVTSVQFPPMSTTTLPALVILRSEFWPVLPSTAQQVDSRLRLRYDRRV
jgi:hypothetical protein